MDEKNLNTELIIKCLSNSANSSEKEELLKWISASKENEAFYCSLKDLFEAGDWEKRNTEARTSQNWQNMLNTISVEAETEPKKTFRLLTLLKYAAVLAVGVLITSVIYNHSKPNLELKNQVVTGIGERTQMILPDGTLIWVNACSSVSYTYNYGTKARDIYLKGEAYFKVAKNPEIPFVVHAQGHKVTALGTAFNVSAYESDSDISAVLLEGSIKFEKARTGETQIIKPGEKVYYDKNNNQTKVEKVNPSVYVAWSNGETRFEHLKMEEITKRLQRAYHVTFILENEKIRNMRFTGTFRNYESLEQILKVLSTNANLNCKLVRDTVFLK